MNIPFNKPYLTGKETAYIKQAVASGKISGNGDFTKKCQAFFEENFGIKKVLLTTSCTDALEMAAILIDIQPGDEVIMPSYTFVSTANAFVLRGAKIVFCDSRKDHPGMDEDAVEGLISKQTKAIVPVHYAGVACDMEKLLTIAKKHDLYLVEDAAQAIESYYTFSDGSKKPLGSIGDLATFSFHETKNIISGEGGCLAINNPKFIERAEIIWEKGTNRSAFFRGEIDKYGWVDVGSSFLPSEVTAAFLWAQLEQLEDIQTKRRNIWQYYHDHLENNYFTKPFIPEYASNNAHMFYLTFNRLEERSKTIQHLKSNGVLAVFHYLSLHKSVFYQKKHDGRKLPQADFFSKHLLRLPFYNDLKKEELSSICKMLNSNESITN